MKKKLKPKKMLKTILWTILSLILLVFLIRIINPTEIDDVTPGIPCPELSIYNPDVLYIIPNFEGNLISENKGWCKYILSLNKTLYLHGLTHTYQEFLENNITQTQLEQGILEFKECFGYAPESFKPPQLKINSKNKNLIKENRLKRKTVLNQLTHKVYHCDDSDIIPNKIIKIF